MAKSTSTFIKEKFKGTWAQSAKKEAFVKEQIEKWTHHTLTETGFGAGSTDYIEGASGDHGYDKAEPDFRVNGTNIAIEVTGPLRSIRMSSDLLINTKKVQYALEHPEREYWMGWVNGVVSSRSMVRFVRVGEIFRESMANGTIVHEQFESRGFQQFFYSIPCTHKTVISFDRFIQYLNSIEHDTTSIP